MHQDIRKKQNDAEQDCHENTNEVVLIDVNTTDDEVDASKRKWNSWSDDESNRITRCQPPQCSSAFFFLVNANNFPNTNTDERIPRPNNKPPNDREDDVTGYRVQQGAYHLKDQSEVCQQRDISCPVQPSTCYDTEECRGDLEGSNGKTVVHFTVIGSNCSL